MTRIWRLLRLLWTITVHTRRLSRRAATMEPSKQYAFRARMQRIGCEALCRVLDIEVRLDGEVPDRKGMLAVSNHLGLLDTIVIASRIPVAFVSKAEVARWPYFGWVTRTMGVFFVERQRALQAGDFVAQVQQRLDAGVHVMVFPEGKTSHGDSVLPFKTGSFEAVAGTPGALVLPLALDPVSISERPITPELRRDITWADDSRTFLGEAWHLLGLRKVVMLVKVGPPIEAGNMNRKELAQTAHAFVTALRATTPIPPSKSTA